MRQDKTKLTAAILIALVVVCGGSFLAVKNLNNQTFALTAAPSITTAFSPVTTTADSPSSVDMPTTAPMATTESTTAEERSTTDGESSAADSLLGVHDLQAGLDGTTASPFSTFPQGSALSTSAKESDNDTTKPTAPSTSRQAITTTPATTEEQQKAEDVIKSAAVFSDGFLSYMFDPKGDFYFTNNDPWQRNFGFNELYDVAAPFVVMYYDTIRCKFTYDNKDWLVQFWKGQYGFVFIGAEIGVYNKPLDRTYEHYDCANDEDSLMMSLTCYRKGKEIFTREYAKYWWCTGFVPGKLDKFSDRSELSLNARITMKDYKMLLSFCGAMKENGFVLNENYTTSGLDVFITW